MKSTFRTMTIVACFALVSLTSCYFPGSDQYKIKSATKEYVKSQLGEGEKFRYGYLDFRENALSADVGTLRFRIGYLGGERQGVDQ